MSRTRSKSTRMSRRRCSDACFREEIGVLTSLALLKNVVDDLEAARNNGESSLTLYFTKESHIHTLMNLILAALPQANRRIPELDYAVSLAHFVFNLLAKVLQSCITFELYERNNGRGKSDKEYSIKLSMSEGAHSSNVLDSALDARHSLTVQAKRYAVQVYLWEHVLTHTLTRKLTQHLPYSLVIERLSKHFHRLEKKVSGVHRVVFRQKLTCLKGRRRCIT